MINENVNVINEQVDVLFKVRMTPEEIEALDTYVSRNALKKGPLLKVLLIQELQAKQFLQRPDYKPPATASAMIKGSRK